MATTVSDKARLPLEVMQDMAHSLAALLRPACERLEIAGSIRRQRRDVGDIELLAVPKIDRLAGGLFGDALEDVNLLDVLCDRLLTVPDVHAEGDCRHAALSKRLDKNGQARWGARYKAITYHSLPVDLFVCLPPAQWGLLCVIRTGPADFGKNLVTTTRQGGWLPDYLQVKDGALRHRATGEVVPTPTEADVFRVLGRPYLPPEQREAPAPRPVGGGA